MAALQRLAVLRVLSASLGLALEAYAAPPGLSVAGLQRLAVLCVLSASLRLALEADSAPPGLSKVRVGQKVMVQSWVLAGRAVAVSAAAGAGGVAVVR